MPVPTGGRGRTGTRDRVAAAECQWRIDGQRPVTEWGGPPPSLVEPKSAAPSRMGISILVVLVSLLVASGDTTSFASSPAVPASRGSGRRSLSGLWRGSPTNDLASRPTRTGRTPTHSHSGQFMTRMHPNPISRFHRHPLRLGTGPSRPARGGAGNWSTAGYRYDRINSGDPHISQRSFDSMPGGQPQLAFLQLELKLVTAVKPR